MYTPLYTYIVYYEGSRTPQSVSKGGKASPPPLQALASKTRQTNLVFVAVTPDKVYHIETLL